MLQTLKTARHQRRQEQRRHGAGTGPKHRRPESPAQSLVSTLNLRNAVRAEKYYRREPSASHPSSEASRDQAQPDIKTKDSKRLRRRALKIGIPVLAAAVGAGLAVEVVNSEASPGASSQTGIANQAGNLAKWIYRSYNNVSAGGNGNDTAPGKTIGVSIVPKEGGTDYMQISGTRTVPGWGGKAVPSPDSITNISDTRDLPDGRRIVTIFSHYGGSWSVSRQVSGQGSSTKTEIAVVDGETNLRETITTPDGITDTTKNIFNPDMIDSSAAGIYAEVNGSAAQLDQTTRQQYQAPRPNYVAV